MTDETQIPRYELQGIFDTEHPERGWLYTVRVDVRDQADAERKTRELSRRFGQPARVRIEDWNHKDKSPLNGFRYEYRGS